MLSNHPDVAAVAIVPQSDLVMGEIGVAVVVPRDAGRPRRRSTISATFAAPHVAAYKLPEAVHVVDDAAADRDGEGRPPRARRDGREGRDSSSLRGTMELDFTDDQDDLRDAIRAVLAQGVADRARARRRRDRRTARRELWDTFVELGWPALTVPEADGGIGLGAVEAAILAEELGRVDHARARCSRRSPSSCPRSASAAPPHSRRAGSARSRPASARARSRSPRRRVVRSGRRTTATMHDRRRPTCVLTGDEALRRRRRRGRRARRRRARPGARATTACAPSSCRSPRRRHAGRTRSTAAAGSRTCALDGVARRAPIASSATAIRSAALAARHRGGDGRARARDGRHRADDLRRDPGVRQAARAVRRADRLVPGDQAQVRRHADRARAGPVDRLLRRAHDRRGRPAPRHAPRRSPRPRPATASGCSARKASRSTAASATRGSTTCTST